MTERQKRFVENYLETGNARQSALRAGYTAGYAEHVKRQKGVKDYIEGRIKSMDSQRIANSDEIGCFLTGLMRGDIPDEKSATVRLRAAELLSKRLGSSKEDEDLKREAAVIIDDVTNGACSSK